MTERGKKIEENIQTILKNNNPLIVPIKQPRFGNGEGKIEICDSVRAKDIYILSDVGNYSTTYPLPGGIVNHYSPDDHFRDIQRAIIAMRNHANKITVIMPLLYSSRQHRRKNRESLDCASALQELNSFYGVNSIITIDVHDTNITNALPLNSFENIYPTGLILKSFLKNELKNIDLNNLIIISPDTGAVERARFYSSVFKSPLGIFYKQRDYNVVGGKNEIISHDYAGPDVSGKDAIVVDDMISSGDSSIDVAEQLTNMGVKNIYFIITFPLFVNGITKFQEKYKEGKFTKLYTTNFTYIPEEYKNEPWIEIVDGNELLARIITTLNKNESIASLIDEKSEVASHVDEMRLLLRKK
ncbi:MAG: ribose-phosphate diphosphokinase [Tenericutes bacterium]|nr:ribose-phosphate diphosphokinase [Mycoplasmatota bacterium]